MFSSSSVSIHFAGTFFWLHLQHLFILLQYLSIVSMQPSFLQIIYDCTSSHSGRLMELYNFNTGYAGFSNYVVKGTNRAFFCGRNSLWPARATTTVSLAAPRHPLAASVGWGFLRGPGGNKAVYCLN